MNTVEQADAILHQNLFCAPAHSVPLAKSLGHTLRETLYADRDFPHFDRATMDGIAIPFTAFANGERHFRILGTQAAGMPRLNLADLSDQNTPACIEIMTGAMLPFGTDTVLRYEDLHLSDGLATIQIEQVHLGQNIHYQGIDRKKGDVLIPIGRRITAAEIGTAATIGKVRLLVSRAPRTAIISTGDELVAVGDTPLEHQIRRSNVFSLQALLTGLCTESDLFHFPDDEKIIHEGLQDVLARYELVVLSGAVSAGKFDYVPKVLADLGVEKQFHQVAQRPGKPFWFGRSDIGTVVFALPGNPVSTFLCACRYVLPWLRESLGLVAEPAVFAILDNDITFKPDLTYFVPVKTRQQQGVLFAQTFAGHGSGDLANLNDADGFLELPRAQNVFAAGGAYRFWRYRVG